MTTLLEQALAKVNQLPATQQDVVAQLILEELADQQRWDLAFENSQDQLAALAREAADELKSGNTRPLNPDNL